MPRHPGVCLWGLGSLPAQPCLTAVQAAQMGCTPDPVTCLWDSSCRSSPHPRRSRVRLALVLWSPWKQPFLGSSLCCSFDISDSYQKATYVLINQSSPQFPHLCREVCSLGLQPQMDKTLTFRVSETTLGFTDSLEGGTDLGEAVTVHMAGGSRLTSAEVRGRPERPGASGQASSQWGLTGGIEFCRQPCGTARVNCGQMGRPSSPESRDLIGGWSPGTADPGVQSLQRLSWDQMG